MYTQFYKLKENPFRLTPDPRFIYFTPAHSECLSSLVFGIMSRRGFMVVAGDAGTGKTTLIHALLGMLAKRSVSCAFIFHPSLEPLELLESILTDLGIEVPASRQKAAMLRALHSYLLKRHEEGSTTALILDEGHKLSKTLLEEVRLLSNLETSRDKLLQIVIAGQNELDDLFRSPDLRQLKQRISLRTRLEPLTPAQTAEYMQKRMSLCGRNAVELFPVSVQSLIQRYSNGIPRLINSICDNALLLAFAEGAASVSPRMIHEVARDLDLPGALATPAPALPPPVAAHPPGNGSVRTSPQPGFRSTALRPAVERKGTLQVLSDWLGFGSKAVGK